MRVERLIWGVKHSFRSYVEMSGGSATLVGEASLTEDGRYAFPLADGDLSLDLDGRPAGGSRFAGGLAFEAHGGLLRVTLSEPGIDTTGEAVVLTVAEGSRRTSFARLDVDAGVRQPDGSAEIPVRITLDGMMILGDHYPPGTLLDPVRLVPA